MVTQKDVSRNKWAMKYKMSILIFLASIPIWVASILNAQTYFSAQAAPEAWEQVVYPLGSGFESSWIGGWVKIHTQNTVNCSTDANNVIYTQTRTPPYTNDVDWARWRPTIPSTGEYDVYVYIPDYTHGMNVTAQAQYKINHAGGQTPVTVNQNNNKCSWFHLGRYTFNAGTGGIVYMGDYTGDNPQRLIAADGVKFVQVQGAPTEIILDDGGSGFSASAGWSVETSGWTRGCTGQNNDARWTYSRYPGNTNDVDTARWTPTITQAGSYEVFVFLPGVDNGLNDTQNARYKIHHAAGENIVTRAQRNNWCTWISLGTFYFEAGSNGWVQLGDYTNGESPQTSVVADAVKWVYTGSTPPPTPPPTPTPPPPSVSDIVTAARADIGMPYWASKARGQARESGPFGPWHFEAGVCTDVVIDAYVAGAGENWSWTQFWRNSETMRKYFIDNEIYLNNNEAWQAGDIFFVGKNNHAWHSGVVTEVNAEGQPTKFVHASSPGTTASERDWFWSWCCNYQVLGHGRLMVVPLAAPETQVDFYELSAFLTSESQTFADLSLFDAAGNFVSRLFDMGFPASSNPDYNPYLMNATYDNDSTTQWIQLDNVAPGTYRLELVGKEDTTYVLELAVLKNGQVVDTETYSGTLLSGKILVLPLTVGAQWELLTTSQGLSAVPVLGAPDQIEVHGTTATFVVSELTGLAGVANIQLQASDFSVQVFEQIPASAITFKPESFSLTAGGQQTIQVTVAPEFIQYGEIYLGSIQVISDLAGVRKIPAELVTFEIFLPALLR